MFPDVNGSEIAYDTAGNPVKVVLAEGVTESYTYDTNRSLLTVTDSLGAVTTYIYDAIGNLTAKTDNTGVTTYVYDALNQLAEVVNPDGTWQHNTYDASGIRSMIAENGVTTEFMSFNGLVLSGYNKDEEQTEHYYYGNSLLAVAYPSEEVDLYYFLKNSHGDVIGLTDNNGTLKETYRYDAFGTLIGIKSLNENGVLAETETAVSRFLYGSEQLDNITGLYYLRARQYDTILGRFTQEDTYLGDGRNLYAYVSNNPLKYVDPSGHCRKNMEKRTKSQKSLVNNDFYGMLKLCYGGMRHDCQKNRKILNEVSRKKVLFVTGARQIGKTFSIRNFGKRYSYFVEINFFRK